MMFMNEYDIATARNMFSEHDILGPATETLNNLMVWVNNNSDGWAYWPKPTRAAAKLMTLIEDARREHYRGYDYTATAADVNAAYRPIKAFLTRQNLSWEIVNVR